MNWTPKVHEALGWMQPRTAYRFDRITANVRCRMWRQGLVQWTGFSDESGMGLFCLTSEGQEAAAKVQGGGLGGS